MRLGWKYWNIDEVYLTSRCFHLSDSTLIRLILAVSAQKQRKYIRLTRVAHFSRVHITKSTNSHTQDMGTIFQIRCAEMEIFNIRELPLI